MALENLAAVSAALSTIFAPELTRQYNRMGVTLALLGAERGSGKAATWDVEFSGAEANAAAEGADVTTAEMSTDPVTPASMAWAIYRQSFGLTEHEVDVAASSTGTPDVLMDMFEERVINAHHALCARLNQDVLTGTGTAPNGQPNLVGLFSGPLEATGSYAGIARGQYPEWSGNVIANGGVPRPLTVEVMNQLEQNIFVACGEPPNLIIASPGVVRKYEGFFETVRRVIADGRGPFEYGAGATQLFYKGVPVIRDRNGPPGRLIMANSNYLKVKYLPHVNPGDGLGHSERKIEGSAGVVKTATEIPARIVLLGKVGDAIRASVKTTVQLVVKRPNSSGYISDIAEV